MFFRSRNHNKITEYLQDHHLIKRPNPIWPKAALILAVAIILSAIVLWPAAVNGYKIYDKVKSLDATAGAILENVSREDLPAVSDDLKSAEDDLSYIQARAKDLGLVLHVPPIGKSYRTADQMLSASINLIQGYRDMIGAFSNLSSATQEGRMALNFSSAEGRRAILKSIVDNRDKIEDSRLKIKSAKAALAGINTDDLTGIFKDKVVYANTLLSEIIGQSETALPLLRYLPELAGYGSEKNYLVLFQNNMELRPSGGFIGSYGLLTVKDGEIIRMQTDDIYNLDKLSKDKMFVPAPWPMTAFNSQKYLFMRDANWSPDWPTDAKEINWFWNAERANAGLPAVKLDGIIAITPDFIANFLELTGPITADGITFDHDNFALQLEKTVEFDYIQRGLPLSQRKSIIGDLSKDLLSRLMSAPPKDLLKIWLVAKKDIEEKQIITWLADSEMQEYIREENWAGEVKQTDGDYLFIVDANLGALKTDSVMKREIKYSLNQDNNGDLIGRAEITYIHAGKAVPALISRYRTFARVYTPADTWYTRAYLKDAKGETELGINKEATIGNELGKRYLAAFITVEPGTSKTLVVEYRLPEKIKADYRNGLYKFSVQKQPGTVGHKLNIDLRFDQPIIAYYAGSLPAKLSGRNLIFNTDLRIDREVTVKF